MLSEMLKLAGMGTAIIVLLMFVLWLVQQRTKNATIVDPAWTFAFAILAILYAALGTGDPVYRWTMAVMVTVWSLRLGLHLAARIPGEPEDGRYHELREKWTTGTGWKFFLVFEAQAILDVLLSIPFLLVAFHEPGALGWPQFIGIALWVIAVVGESVADAQLARFKRYPANRGEVCQDGLWNYSRHPNYFFEWLVWIGWAIFAVTAPWGWLAFSAPILMFLFLSRFTGIPATEAQSLRSKGEKYARYQRTTSALVPWFKKEAA